ncbi:MAG: DNA-processing protein DprA [Paludibacteraceae bacterium]|nr:DNA-processing protein DprA [Paludibacteraceae bacterium]
MNPEQLKYVIALPLLPEVGLRTARALIEFFGSAESVFHASREDLLAIPNVRKDTVDAMTAAMGKALQRAEQEMAFIGKNGIRTCYFEDSDYPYRLRECVDAPLLLYCKGNINVNCDKLLSVVGTRMPTDNGKQLCRQIVSDLAEKTTGLTIVSGLAYGIDVTAHKAALAAGIPTIIVPGHGLDRIYPYMHRQVAVEALKTGGIITEYMSGTEPDRQNFVARNRIIAGLSDATLVVESKQKGGSLITADMANGYNREVFAVPGRPKDATSAGCNMLIKQQKAMLVETADDIIAAMQWKKHERKEPVQTEIFDDLSDEDAAILGLLRSAEDGLHVNQIVMETKLPYSRLTSVLMMMEMRGLVRSLPGNIYKAAK